MAFRDDINTHVNVLCIQLYKGYKHTRDYVYTAL